MGCFATIALIRGILFRNFPTKKLFHTHMKLYQEGAISKFQNVTFRSLQLNGGLATSDIHIENEDRTPFIDKKTRTNERLQYL